MWASKGLSQGLWAGGGVMGAMAVAGAEALATQVIIAAANNKGDPGKIFKAITTSDSIKALAVSVAAAGVTNGLEKEFGLALKPQEIAKLGHMDRLVYFAKSSALKAGVSSSLSVIIQQEDVGRALKSAVISTAANTLGGYGAKTAGNNYDDLGYVLHKLTHAAIGGSMGAILSEGKIEGVIAGTLGGAGGEILGGLFVDGLHEEAFAQEVKKAHAEGRPFDPQNYFEAVQEKLKTITDFSKLGVATAALLTRQNVGIAADTAENAIENNLVPLILAAPLAPAAIALIEGLLISQIVWEVVNQTCGQEIAEAKETLVKKVSEKLNLAPTTVEPIIDTVMIGASALLSKGKGLPKASPRASSVVEKTSQVAQAFKGKTTAALKTSSPKKTPGQKPEKKPERTKSEKKAEKKAESIKTKKQTSDGRAGRQKKLKDLANNDKIASRDKGWIQQELNSIKKGKRKNIRNPIGKELAHKRGNEASKGYSYEHSQLQDIDLHKLQHKYDNFGRNNKPPKNE